MRKVSIANAFFIILLVCLGGLVRYAAAAPTSMHDDVVFTRTTPLADFAEIERRTRPPVYASKIAAHGPAIDPAKEHFLVYVPAKRPPQGYALLVFVPPWDRAHVPPDWASVFDDLGVIFVSASSSGNDADVRARRMPLAVTAAVNAMQEYAVDPSRVFVGGFSGGARVALGLALGWPDLFRGALLNSGGDPLGSMDFPIPPADLFAKFQENSQVFYIIGDGDRGNDGRVNVSLHSLADWCVFHTGRLIVPHMGHETASPVALEKGLTALLKGIPSSDDLAACRAGVQTRLDAKREAVEDLIAKGDKPAARRALDALDAEFGGLAAPKTLELDSQIH